MKMNVHLRDRRPGVQWLVPLTPKALAGGQFWYRVAVPADVVGGSVTAHLLVAEGKTRGPERRIDVADGAGLAGLADVRTLTLFELGSVVILPLALYMPVAPVLVALIDGLREAGASVWLDLDDDRLHMQGLVPWAHAAFGGFPGYDRRQVQRTFAQADQFTRRCARAATGIIAATPALAAVARRYNNNVVVLRNMVDRAAFAAPRRRPVTSRRPLCLGYAGAGLSHHDDLDLASPGLVASARTSGAALHFWGTHPGNRLQHESGVSTVAGTPTVYTFHGYIPDFPTYQNEIGRLDVAVAPLRDIPINRARSATSWLEHGYHGTAMVVSDLEPYAVVEHGVTGFKARTPEDFAHYLRLLVDLSLIHI